MLVPELIFLRNAHRWRAQQVIWSMFDHLDFDCPPNAIVFANHIDEVMAIAKSNGSVSVIARNRAVPSTTGIGPIISRHFVAPISL